MSSSGGGSNVMVRAPKITKVMKVVQLLRMIKLIKLMKNKQHLQKQFHNGLKVSSGYERLFILLLTEIYITHLLACIWIFIGLGYIFLKFFLALAYLSCSL